MYFCNSQVNIREEDGVDYDDWGCCETAEVRRTVDLQKVFSIRMMSSSLAGSLMDTEGRETADGSNWQMGGF